LLYLLRVLGPMRSKLSHAVIPEEEMWRVEFVAIFAVAVWIWIEFTGGWRAFLEGAFLEGQWFFDLLIWAYSLLLLGLCMMLASFTVHGTRALVAAIIRTVERDRQGQTPVIVTTAAGVKTVAGWVAVLSVACFFMADPWRDLPELDGFHLAHPVLYLFALTQFAMCALVAAIVVLVPYLLVSATVREVRSWWTNGR
jgi:hypothetical protein